MSRPVLIEDLPAGPKRIARRAAEAGWTVKVTHARGPWLNVDGSSPRNVDSYNVLCFRDTPYDMALGMWVGATTSDVKYQSGVVHKRNGLLKAGELIAYLEREPERPS